jgi:Mg-dependent DNase
MDLYDIHTHDALTSESDDDVPKRNITYILNVYPLGFEYAKDSDECNWFSCGVHPWYSEDAEPQLKFLKEVASDKRIVAIGEAGFDKLKGPSLDIQQKVFEQQIELSEQLQKPLIIHCVKSWDRLLQLHKKCNPKQTWIMHGYRGKPDLTRQLLAHGFMFSVSDKYNKDTLKLIPLDRLFCETDVSDISIEAVYEDVALSLDMPTEVLASHIQRNVKRIFPLIQEKVALQKDII